MIISDKIYDILKWITLIFLPATGALYSALATIWEWPYGTEIGGTIAAITAFLGAVLQISSAKYKSFKQRGVKK